MAMSSQIIKSLKLDAQNHFSIILKHVILSGINGFKSGTNGIFFYILVICNFCLIRLLNIIPELMNYLKTVMNDDRQNGLLLRFSSHLSLFYRSASFQIRVCLFDFNNIFLKLTHIYFLE
jgi:hypothetical protein